MAGLQDQINPNLTYVDEVGMFSNAFSWEPKKQHQFILSIDGPGVAIPSYLIKASGKPQLTQGEVTLDHINVQRYVKGKSTWNALSITLYDAIVPSGAQAVMDWVLQHHESHTGRDGYSTYYKKTLTLQQLSPLGEIIEEWKLYGAFITDSNWGTLDWGTEDVVTIELSLRYDWAQLSF
jgi:hypothetical protein